MTQLKILWATFIVLSAGIQYGCGSLLSLPAPASGQQTSTSPTTGDAHPQKLPGSVDGMELVISHPHARFTSAVALSPDARYILTGSFDGTAKLWDVTSGQVVRTFPRLMGVAGMGVDEVAFSNDGTKVGVSGIGDKDYQFDVLTGHELPNVPKLAPRDVSPDGRLKVSQPRDGSRGRLIVEEVASSRTVQTLETGMTSVWGFITTMRFSRDGRYLAWAGTDVLSGQAMAKIWEVSSWKLVATLPASAINFSRDSRTLVLGEPTGTAPYLRDLSSGEETHLAAAAGPSGVTDIAMADAGRSVLAGMADGNAILWDLSSGHIRRTFECGKGKPVGSVAVSTQDLPIVTACTDGSVGLWDASTGKSVRTLGPSLSQPGFLPSMARYSLKGRSLVFGMGDRLGVWDAGENKEPRRINLPQAEAVGVYERTNMEETEKSLRDIKGIPEEEKERQIQDMKAATEAMIAVLKEQSKIIQTLAVHPHGHMVAVSMGAGLFLLDIKNGQVVRKIDDKVANYLAFSPDGQTLMSEKEAWDPSTGRVRPTATKNAKATLEPSSMEYWKQMAQNPMDEMRTVRGPVAISLDSRFEARAEDLTINVSNVASGQTQELQGHTGKITGLAFAPDGRTLISGSHDGTVRLWDLQSGKEIAALISLGVANP